MSITQLSFTVLTVLALAIGQILFKLAARAMSAGVSLVDATVFNGWLWISLVVYGLATITWIALLRQVPLNLAYPFVALAFVFVPVLGWWLLGEPLRWQNMAGAGLILAGVWVSVGVK